MNINLRQVLAELVTTTPLTQLSQSSLLYDRIARINQGKTNKTLILSECLDPANNSYTRQLDILKVST